MMAGQQPLVDTPRARTTDPETSHIAGDSVAQGGKLRARQVICKMAVNAWPGCTATELADRLDGVSVPDRRGVLCPRPAGWWRYETSRRLAELKNVHAWAGPKRRCSINGTLQVTWWPTRHEAEVAAGRAAE